MRLEVLRLGHRAARDKRITTHVCLTARALGAARVRIAEEDPGVVKSVLGIAARFGGAFEAASGTGWKGPIKQWKDAGGQVVHLTMYGEPMGTVVPRVLATGKDVLVVVGAEKVPFELYEMADFNVAVGSQPHSEVAALALCLDRLRAGAWEADEFHGAKMRVVPSARGKHVLGDAEALGAEADTEQEGEAAQPDLGLLDP